MATSRWGALSGMAGALTLVAGCGALMGSEMSRRADADIEMARLRQAEEKAEVSHPGTYLSLIRQMQGQGLYYASLAHIDAYQQRYGQPLEILLLRADALRETDQLTTANADYQTIVASTSSANVGSRDALLNASAWRGVGLMAGRQGQFGEAARCLQMAAQGNPTDAHIASDLGYALMRAGEVEPARVPLMQAVQLDVASPRIAGNLMIWLIVNARKEDAESLAAHAKLGPPARKIVDEEVIRVQAAWRERRRARQTAAAGVRAEAGVAPAAPKSSPITFQHGRLLDILGASQ